MRINHYLSQAGICSRRAADKLVQAHRVRINGEFAKVGQQVSKEDEILLDDRPVRLHNQTFFYRLYHKPCGVITTQNTQVEANLLAALASEREEDWPEHFFAVGRLDKASEGVLLLTNNGQLANNLLQLDKSLPKRYLVTVTPAITQEFLQAMACGVDILNTKTKPCQVLRMADNLFQIELHQGLNRQIRRMCQTQGYQVIRLLRFEFADLGIENLPAGKTRNLTEIEIHALEKRLNNVT